MMTRSLSLLLLGAIAPMAPGADAENPRYTGPVPACTQESGRRHESILGSIERGRKFTHTGAGWIFTLAPTGHGWSLHVSTVDRQIDDLSRLTPPWHFVPNPREIDGWHFRNADNTGPNDGSVNANGTLREFIFSPAVGRDIDYQGSGTKPEDVEKVRAWGRGWLFIDSYVLTPPKKGEKAAFESIRFHACLTWPE